MTVRLISVVGESPHEITNGYNLRVNKILVNAARRAEVEVHCIAPVTAASSAAALAWAASKNIHFHGIMLEREMLYDQTLRAIFKKKADAVLTERAGSQSIIVAHGLVPIVDLADSQFARLAMADLIDETGPFMKKDIITHLTHGRCREFVRSLKNYLVYCKRTVGRFERYKSFSVVAHDDAHRLRKLLPATPILVIPNGVEPPAEVAPEVATKQPTVMFHGVYGYGPNEEAALFLIESVAPLLMKNRRDFQLLLAGRNPTRRMLEAKTRVANVEIVGEIDNMSRYLLAASVGAYPIFTRTGLQNKILEAWSHGLPVITTPKVMSVFHAFSADARHCALTALSAREFAERIGELIEDADSCRRLRSNSFDFVKRHFEWRGVVDQFLGLQ